MRNKTLKHYKILRLLGTGGSGSAYLADDTKLLRPVVLKVLRRTGPGDHTRETTLREARLASAIEHPNVCSIYEVDEVEGRAFIVMQFVPGRTLAELIESGPLSLQLALSVGIQIADGLTAAHRLGIIHRDLKPANVMISEGGLVKILDFGVAKRSEDEAGEFAGGKRRRKRDSSARGGTVSYMAPEQFVTGASSEQTDVFALGVMIYQMVTGVHPFSLFGAGPEEIARHIEYVEPAPPRTLRQDLPAEFEGVIGKALAKQPSERYDSAATLREALKTLMKSLHFEAGVVPGEVSAVLPIPADENGGDKRAGLFSILAERLMGRDDEVPQNSLVALPFNNLGKDDEPPFYGLALAEAVAARLARLPRLAVRSFSPASPTPHPPADPVQAGEKLRAAYVLAGSYLRSERGFDLNWQLIEVASGTVRTGGTVSVPSLDLVRIQNEIGEEVYATLRGVDHLQAGSPQLPPPAMDPEVSEDYLQGRALLSNFIWRSHQREDLDGARNKFRSVLAHEPEFAPAHSALGITQLQYAQNALGGVGNLVEAQRCFEHALRHDPQSAEAHLFRVYTFLARGEKESARRGVHHLLETAGHDPAVHMVAGIILRQDGLYQTALEEFTTALRLNPDAAVLVYNNRARVYHYQGQLELAMAEVNKGMTLEPRHPLLLTSLGYLYFRQGLTAAAVETLETLLGENDGVRIAYPTLAMCYLAAGRRARAEALIREEILTAAEADGEMAYRLATFYALDGEATEALHWLRRAVYLGDENYPWFKRNPAWGRLRGNEDLGKILSDLRKSHQLNRERWQRLLYSLMAEKEPPG